MNSNQSDTKALDRYLSPIDVWGLAITKSIIDLMGGTIEVLTAPGTGTEIVIGLKLKLAEQKEIEEAAKASQEIPEEDVDFSGKRLLLVEDNQINLEIAQMPVMDGYTATIIIRNLEDETLAQIPVIAMTANAFAEDIRTSEKAGMQGHIAKPIDVNIMKKTLAEVLNDSKS